MGDFQDGCLPHRLLESYSVSMGKASYTVSMGKASYTVSMGKVGTVCPAGTADVRDVGAGSSQSWTRGEFWEFSKWPIYKMAAFWVCRHFFFYGRTLRLYSKAISPSSRHWPRLEKDVPHYPKLPSVMRKRNMRDFSLCSSPDWTVGNFAPKFQQDFFTKHMLSIDTITVNFIKYYN